MTTDNTKKPPQSDTATAANRRDAETRRAAEDRRTTADRRNGEKAVAVERRTKERRADSAPAGRRKVERRINEYPLSPDILEFINAINEFKSVQQKPFPTWTDIYGIFVNLGYKRDS